MNVCKSASSRRHQRSAVIAFVVISLFLGFNLQNAGAATYSPKLTATVELPNIALNGEGFPPSRNINIIATYGSDTRTASLPISAAGTFSGDVAIPNNYSGVATITATTRSLSQTTLPSPPTTKPGTTTAPTTAPVTPVTTTPQNNGNNKPGGPTTLEMTQPDTRYKCNVANGDILSVQRVAVDPKVNQILAVTTMANWKESAKNIMLASGPMPSWITTTPQYDKWMDTKRAGKTTIDPADFLDDVMTAYHETMHEVQFSQTANSYGCMIVGPDEGYRLPGIKTFPQSEILADTDAQIDLRVPPTSDLNKKLNQHAKCVDQLYLSPFDTCENKDNAQMASQQYFSQMWEMNAYALELELQVGWQKAGLPAYDNTFTIAVRMLQLKRYLMHLKSTYPDQWAAMRASDASMQATADQWNLISKVWRASEYGPAEAYDIAFGSDMAIINEFTNGKAGKTAPPNNPLTARSSVARTPGLIPLGRLDQHPYFNAR